SGAVHSLHSQCCRGITAKAVRADVVQAPGERPSGPTEAPKGAREYRTPEREWRRWGRERASGRDAIDRPMGRASHLEQLRWCERGDMFLQQRIAHGFRQLRPLEALIILLLFG